uniref:Uncharacterized protein n=1 Tax=Rhizophora mucronata TaxID=61149 RepID=A0A2P2NW54_RHIMU
MSIPAQMGSKAPR